MKRSRMIVSMFVFVSALLLSQTQKNVWKAELDDDVKKIVPVLNGKYLFISSDEYAWFYENATGKKIWSVEVEDYNEKAIHQIVNDTLYLVADEDSLVCYDMMNRSIYWKRGYTGIEQDNFSGWKQLDTLVILSYSTVDIGVSLVTGKELWRTPVEYLHSLVEQGTINAIMLPTMRKYIVITDKEECLLISTDDGKKLMSLPLSEPHNDLVKQKRAWHYIAPDQTLAAFVFEKNYIVINTETNKLVAQIPLKIADQYNPLMPTPFGCAVIGEDRIVHYHAAAGKVSQIPASVDKVRNIIVAQTDSGAFMIVGVEDKIIGWDLITGKLAWQTALKFQPANGFIHRFLAQDSNDVMVTYLDPSSDLKLSLMSINVPTGKINYRTIIAHADESLPNRVLPLPAIASVTGPAQHSFGFEDIGFAYDATIDAGTVVFVIRTSADMMVPNTDKKGGEGFVRVDMKNGQVLGKNYIKIADGFSFDGGLASIAKTMTTGNLILCPGNKNLIALDAITGALRWMLIEQDVNGSYIFDMAMIDTVLYVRTGGFKQEFTYDAKKDKVSQKKLWEEDDYSLLAVDTATGKVLWKRDFEVDPGRIFNGYSVGRYSKGSASLFTADENFLYSIALDPVRKGMLSWKFEFSDSGIGSFDYDEMYQRTTRWTNDGMITPEQELEGAFQLKQTTIAGETFSISLNKVLHAEYHLQSDRLFVFGDDGIAAVNTTTGRKEWYYEWDYDASSIHQQPVYLNGHIFYVVDGLAVLINATNGVVAATAKVDKSSGIFIMPNHSSVVIVNGDELTGIAIPTL